MEIGKFCDIADDFKHGKNFKCGSFVKIEKDVIVGDDVTLENNIILNSGKGLVMKPR
jgi:UDP-3-O-[3-hydroxymyristoyl] glucosamine N-acyltransferase